MSNDEDFTPEQLEVAKQLQNRRREQFIDLQQDEAMIDIIRRFKQLIKETGEEKDEGSTPGENKAFPNY